MFSYSEKRGVSEERVVFCCRFNKLFVEKRNRSIEMDLSTMFDKVAMKAYANIGIDLRVKFLVCVFLRFILF